MKRERKSGRNQSQLLRAIESLESRLLLSATRYVDLNSPGPAHDGTGWDSAYVDLQQALTAATAGDEIRVADGTYKPTADTDPTISFVLKTDVSLLGGYAGSGALDPNLRDIAGNATILSGDIGAIGDSLDNSYHVLVGSGTTATAVLDGFTITAGSAFGSSSANYGAGMYNSAGSPTLINCTFSGNRGGSGGGIYNSSSSPALTNCTVSGNWALYGGGIYNSGGSPTVTNCTFSGNSAAYGDGGGMYNRSSSSPALTNCTFSGNWAGDRGDGIYNSSSAPSLTNCIIWGSGRSPISNSGASSTPVITYSDIQGGYAGTGNIDAAPLFVRSPWTGPDGNSGTGDDDYGDLRLRADSPALDIGSNAAVPTGVSTDLAGNPRIQNGTVDMGAYEGTNTAPGPKTLCVDLSAVGTNTGDSWTNAFISLQSALAAAVDGDTIHVANGTYKPTATTDRTLAFVLRNSVGVYGGYAGYGAADPDARDIAANVTILSGDIGTIGNADNSYHVVVGNGTTATAVLDGFTITAGNANGRTFQSDSFPTDSGGGMCNSGGSPTVTNCTFIGNSASGESSYGGGGMYNYYASPTLTNCTFSGNSVSGTYRSGGGMCNLSSSPKLTNCTFSSNSASSGGGMYNVSSSSSPSLINCTFSGNSASGESGYGGGGMYNYYASPTLTNCTFRGNSAYVSGGGMLNSFSSPALTNCTFDSNSTSRFGGGMYNASSSSSSPSPVLINCTFSGNSATYNGGGMYNAVSSPTLTNCTFSSNAGGGMFNNSSSPALTNCIIWGSGNPPIYNSYSTPVITYSGIQGGYTGIGNINADPQFVRNPSPGSDAVWGTADDDYGDLRLRSGSPCIDAGSNAAVPAGITTDLAGSPRFIDVPRMRDPGAIVDMGAYEYTLPLAASGSAFLLNAAKPSVKISFNGDVSAITLSAGDLLLENLTSGQPIDCSVVATVAYDPGTRSAAWSFAGLLADGNYRATLPAGSVSDAGGNSLASDYSFDFFALAGDANRDRTVDISDLGILATNWQGSGKTFAQGDFNYDGIVDISDLGILATSWQKSLAAPSQPVIRALRRAVAGRLPSAVGVQAVLASKSRFSLAEEVGLIGSPMN